MASRNNSSNINFVPPYEWTITNDIPPNSHFGTITASSINELSIIYFLTVLYIKNANSTKALYSQHVNFNDLIKSRVENPAPFRLTEFDGQLYTTNYFRIKNAEFYLNVLATDSMGSSKQQIYIVKVRNNIKQTKHFVKRRNLLAASATLRTSISPGPPQNLEVIYKTSTTIKLLWKPPKANNQSVEVTNYTIVYDSNEIYSPTSSYWLTNLNSSTSYNIFVYANDKFVFNANGNYTLKYTNIFVGTNSVCRSSTNSEELGALLKVKICSKANETNCQNVTETANDLDKILSSDENLTENDVEKVDEILKNVIPNMKNLSLSQTTKVSEQVLDVIGQIVNKTETGAINEDTHFKRSVRNDFVKSMDEVSNTILEKLSTSNKTDPVKIEAKSITFSALKTKRTNIKISVQDDETHGFPIVFNNTTDNSSNDNANAIEVHIPEETFGSEQSDVAISCTVVHKTPFLFPTNSEILKEQDQTNNEYSIVHGLVIAVKIGGRKVENLTKPITFRFKKDSTEQPDGEFNVNFWDVEKDYGRGAWSVEGIATQTDPLKEFVIGKTNHLTNFALLLDIFGPVYNPYELKLVSLVGIAISITCLSFSLLTLLLFRKRILKILPNKILISLCTSLLFLLVTFVYGVGRTSVKLECQMISAMLHFYLLSTFLWMLIEACSLYLSVVKLSVGLNKRKFFIISTALSWGLPIISVTACIVTNPDHYSGANRQVKNHQASFTYTERSCFIRTSENDNLENMMSRFIVTCVVSDESFHFGVVLPIAFVLLFNGVIFILTMRKIISRRLKLLHEHLQQNGKRLVTATYVRQAFALNLLLGVTWVFAFFAISKAKIVIQWLFCITNALQGMLIFLFHIARNNDIQKEWRGLICPRDHGSNDEAENCPANINRLPVTKKNREDSELDRLTVRTDIIETKSLR